MVMQLVYIYKYCDCQYLWNVLQLKVANLCNIMQ